MDIANLVIRVTSEGLDRARADLDRLRGSAGDAEVRAKKLKESLGRLAKYGAVAFVGVATAALKTADSMQNLNNKIRVATDGIAEYSTAQKEIERIAMGTYSSLESVGELYASNERALGAMGKTQGEVLGFTENITKAMAVSGGSAQSQAAAITQLGQAMASGVLRGDEFNSIAEQAPVLLELLSDKLGMTTGELRAFAAEGGITSEVVYDAISGATDKLDGLMGQTTVTMGQGLQNIKTQWSLFADSLVNTEGGIGEGIANSFNIIAEKMQSARVYLQEFFSDADNIATFNSAVEGLKNVWDNLVSVIEKTAEVIAPVIEFFRENEEISIALAGGIAAVASAFVIYNAAVAIGAFVTGGFVAALALVTAPITLIVVAMTALVAAGIYVYRNWDEIKAKATEIWGAITTYISNKIDAIKSYFSTNFPAMTAIVSGSIEVIKTLFVGGFNLIKNTVTTVLGVIKAVISGDFKTIPDIIGNGLKTAAGIVGSMMTDILNVIKEAGKKLFNIGRDFIQGFINGIKSVGSGVVSAASSMVGNAIAAVKKRQDSSSPSKVTTKLGGDFSQGFINGIVGKSDDVKKAAIQQAQSAIDGVKGSIATLQKQIALFGNNSSLASLLYDIENTDKYKDVSDQLVQQLVSETTALEQLNAQAKAALSIQDRLDKLKADKASSSDALQGMLSGLEQESPLGKIQADYEERLAVIETYEQMHTDMLGVQAEARLAVEQSYMDAKRDLMLTQGEALFGDLAGLAKGFAGEQSGIYKALFLVEKGFAIAQSAIAIQTSIAKAMSVGFPANIPIIGQAVSQGMGIMSSIKGITAGFKTGGYTGNMGASQVAGVVHGQEYVFDAQATKRIGVDNLNAMRRGDNPKGGGDVIINNYSSAKIEQRQDANGVTILDVRDEIKRSWTNTGNPNSFESKQLNRNIQAPRRR